MGIHYDYKSTKSAKLMEKQAKREKKLAEKKAKRLAKEGPKEEETKPKTLDTSKPITLDFSVLGPSFAKRLAFFSASFFSLLACFSISLALFVDL